LDVSILNPKHVLLPIWKSHGPFTSLTQNLLGHHKKVLEFSSCLKVSFGTTDKSWPMVFHCSFSRGHSGHRMETTRPWTPSPYTRGTSTVHKYLESLHSKL